MRVRRSSVPALAMLVVLPAMAGAQTTGQPGRQPLERVQPPAKPQRGSTHHPVGQEITPGRARGNSSSEAGMGRGRGPGPYGLTSDQVTQLQQALAGAGCDPGAVDGRLGRRTRVALACAREKNSLQGNNVNDILRALNLGFTAPDSLGPGRAARRAARGSDAASTSGSPRPAGSVARVPMDSGVVRYTSSGTVDLRDTMLFVRAPSASASGKGTLRISRAALQDTLVFVRETAGRRP